MTSAGSLTGLLILAMLSLPGADSTETKFSSLNEPNVPFPPGYPSASTLSAICHQGKGRPRYPDSFFPPSGVSHWRRRGTAINRLEAWFAYCCSGEVAQTSSQILCCTQQAWKRALSLFCTAEYSTMTLVYECCEYSGSSRWSCFNTDVANPRYTAIPGYTAPSVPLQPGLFIFNSNAC